VMAGGGGGAGGLGGLHRRSAGRRRRVGGRGKQGSHGKRLAASRGVVGGTHCSQDADSRRGRRRGLRRLGRPGRRLGRRLGRRRRGRAGRREGWVGWPGRRAGVVLFGRRGDEPAGPTRNPQRFPGNKAAARCPDDLQQQQPGCGSSPSSGCSRSPAGDLQQAPAKICRHSDPGQPCHKRLCSNAGICVVAAAGACPPLDRFGGIDDRVVGVGQRQHPGGTCGEAGAVPQQVGESEQGWRGRDLPSTAPHADPTGRLPRCSQGAVGSQRACAPAGMQRKRTARPAAAASAGGGGGGGTRKAQADGKQTALGMTTALTGVIHIHIVAKHVRVVAVIRSVGCTEGKQGEGRAEGRRAACWEGSCQRGRRQPDTPTPRPWQGNNNVSSPSRHLWQHPHELSSPPHAVPR
jgi:hypothetical protein